MGWFYWAAWRTTGQRGIWVTSDWPVWWQKSRLYRHLTDKTGICSNHLMETHLICTSFLWQTHKRFTLHSEGKLAPQKHTAFEGTKQAINSNASFSRTNLKLHVQLVLCNAVNQDQWDWMPVWCFYQELHGSYRKRTTLWHNLVWKGICRRGAAWYQSARS